MGDRPTSNYQGRRPTADYRRPHHGRNNVHSKPTISGLSSVNIDPLEIMPNNNQIAGQTQVVVYILTSDVRSTTVELLSSLFTDPIFLVKQTNIPLKGGDLS